MSYVLNSLKIYTFSLVTGKVNQPWVRRIEGFQPTPKQVRGNNCYLRGGREEHGNSRDPGRGWALLHNPWCVPIGVHTARAPSFQLGFETSGSLNGGCSLLRSLPLFGPAAGKGCVSWQCRQGTFNLEGEICQEAAHSMCPQSGQANCRWAHPVIKADLAIS